jgi:Sulfatase-modifying factor enzyme 1
LSVCVLGFAGADMAGETAATRANAEPLVNGISRDGRQKTGTGPDTTLEVDSVAKRAVASVKTTRARAPMKSSLLQFLLLLALFAPPPSALSAECAPDAVPVGPVCVDRYESSLWTIPAENTALIAKVRRGRASHGDLVAGGAVQYGIFPPTGGCIGVNYPASFPQSGAWTQPVYAVAIPGVYPSTCVSWFQAEQACRLSGKRLLRNQEWQAAVAGTQDPGLADDGRTTCATSSELPARAGERTNCVSAWGVHDMVGNAWEWIAEWSEVANDCSTWPFGADVSCYGSSPAPLTGLQPRDMGPPDPHLQGGVIRGGNLAINERSGVFAIYVGGTAATQSRSIGVRCAR